MRGSLGAIGAGLCFVLGTGCVGIGDAASRSDPQATASPETAAEIARLEDSIAADRAALAQFVTEERDLDLDPLHTDEALREIADRLTSETRRLESLRAAQGSLGTSAP